MIFPKKLSLIATTCLMASLVACDKNNAPIVTSSATHTKAPVDVDKVKYAGAFVVEAGKAGRQGEIGKIPFNPPPGTKRTPMWQLLICLHRLERGSVGNIEVDFNKLETPFQSTAQYLTDGKPNGKTVTTTYEKARVWYQYSANIEQPKKGEAYGKIDIKVHAYDKGSKFYQPQNVTDAFDNDNKNGQWTWGSGIFDYNADKNVLMSFKNGLKNIKDSEDLYYYRSTIVRFFEDNSAEGTALLNECEKRDQPYFFLLKDEIKQPI